MPYSMDSGLVYVVADADRYWVYSDEKSARKGYDTAPVANSGTRVLLVEQDGIILRELASMYVEA